jgi:fatty acid CoA ligase FadD9
MTEHVRWTPAEAWLIAEVARRVLVASLDGGPDVGAYAGAGFTITVEQTDDAFTIELGFAAKRATLTLAPTAPAGHRWRDAWMLELERGDDRWYLSAQSPRVEIVRARSGPVRAHLRLQHRAITRELETIVVADVACHKYTRQSSVDSDEPWPPPPMAELVRWMTPTRRERAPWWELDLGKPMYVAWLRIDVAALPLGTRVIVRAYGFWMPDGGPPPATEIVDALVETFAVEASGVAITAGGVVARYLRVELVGAGDVALAVTGTEVLACELFADDLLATLQRSFALFRDRVLVVEPELRYREVWDRAMALARGLAQRLEPSEARVTLAIMLPNRAEWAIADLAALARGYVIVPISPEDADDRLAIILERARPACVICEPGDVERLRRLVPDARLVVCDAASEGAEMIEAFADVVAAGARAEVPAAVPRGPDELHSVLFTSGSTGVPKGAMRSYGAFFAMVKAHVVGHSPRHLSFQPLSHLSERMYLPTLMAHGGTLAYSRGGAYLLDELRALEPTTIGTVPRLFEVVYANYRRRLRAAIAAEPATPRGVLEARALAEARGAFGGRLFAVSVGSAPVSAEVFAFLQRCFADLWVSEGYGSTEVGTIASDGRVPEDMQVKLVPLPNAAPLPDGVLERGEVHVRSPYAITGYLGDTEATAAAFDADGFFATGDLGERDGDGRVRVVGRIRNTVKLAQGEFVSAERIETALATAPIVDRIFVHAQHGAAGVAALVVPQADAAAKDAASVLGALHARARTMGLAAYETPRGVLVIEEPFTVENGLITASGKLARGAIAARYGAELAVLAAGSAAVVELAADDDDVDLRARVARIASGVLGRAIALDEPLARGVDSLSSAEILAALSDELGRDVPLAWWFEARTLGDLATRIAHFGATAEAPSLAELVDADLALPAVPGTPGTAPPKHVLLTGATGFLGAHLVEALHARGIAATCLVRAPDDAAATRRLADALVRWEIAVPADTRARSGLGLAAADQPLLERLGTAAIAGDLADEQLAARLAELPVDGVVHAGAVVSWLAPYHALRAANVLGTHALLEVAAARGLAFHHVSTISTAPPDGDETTQLTRAAALATTPYALSKWVAEQHVRRCEAAAIYRPAMIAGHSQRGVGNRDDFLTRYLVGCGELGLYIDREDGVVDMTPVDYVAAAIATLVAQPPAGAVYHLANIAGSLTFGALGRALAAAGLAVKPASYPEFRTALAAARSSRLHALAAFFPERWALGMGPFPCQRTTAIVGEPPRIDDAVIARYLAALRRRGDLVAKSDGPTC